MNRPYGQPADLAVIDTARHAVLPLDPELQGYRLRSPFTPPSVFVAMIEQKRAEEARKAQAALEAQADRREIRQDRRGAAALLVVAAAVLAWGAAR